MNINDLIYNIYGKFTKGVDIQIPVKHEDEYRLYFQREYKENGKSANSYCKRIFMRNKALLTKDGIQLKELFYNEYITQENGYKHISKKYDISYSTCRKLIELLEIPPRKGYSVITDNLRKKRSKLLTDHYKNRTGWFKTLDRMSNITSRGVQGYYYNKSQNKEVWLRSTWEYIYAKFLDRINESWDVEVREYKLGKLSYRPDFFIYDKDTIKKIVEIKGFWKDKLWKVEKLNEQLTEVDAVVITDIKKYISNGSSYSKELKIWKAQRKLKNEHTEN